MRQGFFLPIDGAWNADAMLCSYIYHLITSQQIVPRYARIIVSHCFLSRINLSAKLHHVQVGKLPGNIAVVGA